MLCAESCWPFGKTLIVPTIVFGQMNGVMDKIMLCKTNSRIDSTAFSIQYSAYQCNQPFESHIK